KRGHTDIVGHIHQPNNVVLSEGEVDTLDPATEPFNHGTDRLDAVVRVLELCRPRFTRIGCLNQILCHLFLLAMPSWQCPPTPRGAPDPVSSRTMVPWHLQYPPSSHRR